MVAIKVPPLGESITEATVSRWLKREGDAVAAGETLVELETDKITVEVPALKSGALSKRAHAEGDVVGVGDILGELDDAATGAATSATPAAPAAAPPPPKPTPVLAAAPAAPAPTPSADVRSAPKADGEARLGGLEFHPLGVVAAMTGARGSYTIGSLRF